MSKRKENSADQPFGDSRLAEFLRRAKPILAAERGWNAQSRMKLRALGDELHLPLPLFETALRKLQGSAAIRGVDLTRYERQFVRFLQKELKPWIGNVLTPPHEQRAIGHGLRDFQIEHDRARELVRQVASQLGIGRVSRLDAAEHVETLIDDVIGRATTASTTIRKRIFDSAKQWGVDAEQTGSLIDNRLAANLQSLRPRSSVWIIVLAVIASAVMLALLAWFVWAQIDPGMRRDENRNDEKSESVGQSDASVNDADTVPDFWSEATQRAWRKLLASDRTMAIPRHLVLSVEVADRRQAIVSIVDLALSDAEPVRRNAEQFLVHIIDDDLEISRQAVDVIAMRMRPDGNAETISMRLMEEAFRAADLLLVLREKSIRNEVHGFVDLGFAELPGMGREPGAELTRTGIDMYLTKIAWQQLDKVAAQNPDVATRLYSSLFKLTQSRSRETESLAWPVGLRIFASNGEAWQLMREAWQSTFASATEDQLFQAFDVLSTRNDLDRSVWLLPVLAAKMNIDADRVPVKEINKTIRARFGLTSETWMPAESRWGLLLELPDFRVALEPDQQPVPQAIANAAWLATAAYLMWRAEQDKNSRFLDSFDQLIADGPRSLAIRRNPNRHWQSLPVYGRVQRRPLPTDIETRRMALEKLQNPEGLSSAVRATALERLAEVADRFADVSPEQATAIVRIMLLAIENPEVVAVEKFTSRFRHWANLATALSEQIKEADVSIDQAVTVASLLMDIKFDMRNQTDWRETLHRALLRQLADGLQHTAEVQGDTTVYQWDELHDYLVELGRIRCLAAGIAGREYSATSSPAELSRLILQQMIGDDPRIQMTRMLADDDLQEAILTTALLADVLNAGTESVPWDEVDRNLRGMADCPTALLACELRLLETLVRQRRGN